VLVRPADFLGAQDRGARAPRQRRRPAAEPV
jgi:hypothetical protein